MADATRFYTENKGSINGIAQEYYEGAAEILQGKNDKELADRIRHDAGEHFQLILADLPDIGGKQNPLLWSFIFSAIALGFFIAARKNGLDKLKAGRIHYEIVEYFYSSKEGTKSLEKATPESIARQKENMRLKFETGTTQGDWVTVPFEDVSNGFDIGWNNRECGILKLYDTYAAREYVPFLCMTDAITYPLRGLGLQRTQTLVDSDHCDFRVRIGGETQLEPATRKLLKAWGKGNVE